MKSTLETQRIEYINRKFIATPISGLIAWLFVGISGLFFPDRTTVWVLVSQFLKPLKIGGISALIVIHYSSS